MWPTPGLPWPSLRERTMSSVESVPVQKRVSLTWSGTGMEYRGLTEGGATALLDGQGKAGPTPMEALLLALAGCMAADVQVILERSRVPFRGLEVEVEGERAPEHPKRYTRISLTYRVAGPGPEHQGKLERAVELSREKFCSVLHSLRPDIQVDARIQREP